jgi:hypothetical protein
MRSVRVKAEAEVKDEDEIKVESACRHIGRLMNR